MKLEHVDGENKGKILLFALSTCGWCAKTRKHLEELKVEYDYIYVDLTEGKERNETVENLQKYNEAISFPTIVYNDEDVIIGYKPEEIDDLLENK
jgi:glutaredoxin-like protein NrdH